MKNKFFSAVLFAMAVIGASASAEYSYCVATAFGKKVAYVSQIFPSRFGEDYKFAYASKIEAAGYPLSIGVCPSADTASYAQSKMQYEIGYLQQNGYQLVYVPF